MNTNAPQPISPFHMGEQEAQSRAGARDRTEIIGQRAIRSFMPDQHRKFFEQLPFVVLGSVDPDGWPWASIVTGGSGFITSPDETSLAINARPTLHDPLTKSLVKGSPIGLLGIEMGTRRRNRMNAKVSDVSEHGIELDVVQSFGNCPKYIQTHDIRFARAPELPIDQRAKRFDHFDDRAKDLISTADTFFVSSYMSKDAGTAADSVDVSHRGGRSGFVNIDGDTLTIPDYAGNNFFNTIGNFLTTPKAGLLFANFATGDLLMLTGHVDILWGDHPNVRSMPGADRAWQFTLDHGVRIEDALPFRAEFTEYSPHCPKLQM